MTGNAENKNENRIYFRNLVILVFFAFATVAYINSYGKFPWGSDTYGHLFKGNILYDSIKEGNLFLNYHPSWYNGIQPYRYWAPLPYYILAAINLFTSDIILTYNVFVGLVFFIGGLGWLSWGYYLKRQNLSMILALLWFFVPNNLRILFSEGNIPYVIINSLIPFVMLFSYRSVKESNLYSYLPLAFVMSLLTLSHAMLTAMTGVALFIYAVTDTLVNKRYQNNFFMLLYAFMGIMLASFWLVPALKGGIFALNKGAVASVMRDLTYYLDASLNPLLRFSNVEIYYYGLAFAMLAIFGLLFSAKTQRVYFIVALIILLGTTKAALPLLEKLPLNQLFWMSRFTSIAMAMIIAGLLLWRSLRKSILIGMILLLMLDSAASFYVLGYNGQYPQRLSETLDYAAKASVQRVAVLDSSYFGSFPSYYIAYNKVGGVQNQVFGWAWQGAATTQNIVMLNTSLEMGYYELMFDRALELGADTLVIKKNFISHYQALDFSAKKAGYQWLGEDAVTMVYKYPIYNSFGTKVDYEGIAIGNYAVNAIYLFPQFTAGKQSYIDTYSFEELKEYKAVYLSGFQYNSKEKAEALVLQLSKSGVKVVIDTVGLSESFMGVSAEPIVINNSYQEMYYKNQKLALQSFPEELSVWKTNFLRGIENKESYIVVNHRIINYIGSKHNKNITFVGLNLPYFAFLSKDETAIDILEDSFGMRAFETPDRTVHPIDVKYGKNTISIKAKEELIIPIAALDAFVAEKGSYTIVNNLINIKSKELEVKIIYPYLDWGIILSLIFLLLIVGLSMTIHTIDSRNKMKSQGS